MREQPKSAEQLKLYQLRTNREKATNAVRQERELQQTQHAQQALKKSQKPLIFNTQNQQAHQTGLQIFEPWLSGLSFPKSQSKFTVRCKSK